MRSLLLFFNIISFSALSAQVITADFQYEVGEESFTVFEPSDIEGLFFTEEAGTDLVWDFRNLTLLDFTSLTTVVLPESLSLVDTFTRANIGLTGRGGEEERYLIQTDSTVEIVGFRTFGGLYTSYPNSSKLMQFPFALGESFTDDYSTVVFNASGDTIRESQFITTYDFIATGTLQLPDEDYENCFLIRSEISTSDNPPLFANYRWYAGSLANLMLEMLVSKADNSVGFLVWQLGLADVVSVEDEFANNLNVKWLTQNQFVINSDKKRQVEYSIMDVSGRMVWQQKKEILIGEQQINIPNLSVAGVYFFSVQDLKTQELKTLQFTTGY
ncbi:MAG: T9SS type A sorting domain-containing protein [Saprospiraceae bacterium]